MSTLNANTVKTEALEGKTTADAITITNGSVSTIELNTHVPHSMGDCQSDGTVNQTSLNVSSITDGRASGDATGYNTVNLTTAMSTTTEPVMGCPHHDSYNRGIDIANHASAIEIIQTRQDTGGLTDVDHSFMFFGDLA